MLSWVFPCNSPFTSFIPGNVLWISGLFGTTKMSVEHSFRTVRGLLIDTMGLASLKISEANANTIIVDAFIHYLLKYSANDSHDVLQANATQIH